MNTFPAHTPYEYDVILLKVCNLSSSLLLSASLLTSLVYTLCNSLLNPCYDFNLISFFNKQSL